MDLEKLATRILRYMEFLLITTVISVYAILIYTSAVHDRSILFSYIVVTSFIHYVVVLVKSPGAALDLDSAHVRGLCTACNRIRSSRTRHCGICGKCYNKRDYHCLLIGRCIAEDNVREMFVCMLFMLVFLVRWFLVKEYKPLLIVPIVGIALFLLWTAFCMAHDKTSKELYKAGDRGVGRKEMARLGRALGSHAVETFFPLVRGVSKVEY